MDLRDITVVMLDRPRLKEATRQVREAGARVRLIAGGDLAAALLAASEDSHLDLLWGIGGTPEGVISAAALKSTGGQLVGRLWPRNDEEARTRTTRLPDAYRWVDGYILDALCDFGVANDIRETPGWIDELAALAARAGMRELAVRAYLHRGQLGDGSALAAAQILAAGIENPALAALLPPRAETAVH
jgi:hypothetical protein